ncbi:DUF896 domain-containing protein [Hathewaya histolytica]|uniref:UPF0291 protein NCTC503_02481 n=2 Tax=Hathewaya histolytica TaxID=1498 RepID=A0A4U9RSB1_HATHI|nr:ortholog of S. aureus MRSA252 (BX571856) SAR1351 [Hathewaya histolytica]
MKYSDMEFGKIIERINELYKKSKQEGLTEEEKIEQKDLREYYLSVMKNNFKSQLSKVKKVPSKNTNKLRN